MSVELSDEGDDSLICEIYRALRGVQGKEHHIIPGASYIAIIEKEDQHDGGSGRQRRVWGSGVEPKGGSGMERAYIPPTI